MYGNRQWHTHTHTHTRIAECNDMKVKFNFGFIMFPVRHFTLWVVSHEEMESTFEASVKCYK